MKTKGISIWERYIEYIVLLVAILVFIAFTVMQFIGNPNAVTKEGREIAPSEVDELLRQEAERLNGMLVQSAPAPISIPEPEPIADDFRARLGSSISPVDSLMAFMPAYSMSGAGGELVEGGALYVEPKPPAPGPVLAQQFFDGLTPEVIASHEGLADVAGEMPYDITWVTPVAVFDLEQALAEFRSDASDRARVPSSWYRDRITILDVKVERQERTGTGWSAPMTLQPIPGQDSLRPTLAQKVDAAKRDDILAALGQPANQGLVVQPPFYETRQSAFLPPDPREQTADAAVADDNPLAEDIRRLRIQRQRYARQRQNLQDFVDQNCGNVGGAGGGPGGPAGGGRAGGGAAGGGGRSAPGGGGFGVGGQAGRRTGNTQDQQQLQQRCSSARERIDRLDRELARVESRLADLGQEIAPEPEEAAGLMERKELLVWAHDLSVETGKTYRYRFTIDVYNPFFARKIQLMPEQHALSESIILKTSPSDWSPEITIDPPLKFFITDARPPAEGTLGSSNLGEARVEMFRFYDGRWWGEDDRFAPGQRLAGSTTSEREGQPPVDIDFGTDWFVLDITAVPGRNPTERYAGQVMLQNLRTGEVLPYRDPRREAQDPEYLRLRDEVELAEVNVASLGSP